MSSSLRSPVARLVKELAGEFHRGRWEMFRTLCELSYCAVAQRGPGASVDNDALEARYMRAIDPYKEHESRFRFPDFLGELFVEVMKKSGDPLGEAAGELEILDSGLAQFFTPYHVSLMTAKMALGGAGDIIEARGYITLGEPACGAGGMVLAAACALEEMGHDPGTAMIVYATDLSETCYQMTYLQLAARGVPARVMRGDTLSGEMFEWACTPAVVGFHEAHPEHFTRAPRHRARPPRARTRKG